MLKIFLILIIIGGLLLGVGIAIMINNVTYLEENHPNLTVFFDGVLLESQKSTTPIELLEGDSITVTVIGHTHSHRLFFALDGPNESKIFEGFFTDSITYALEANSTGIYVINIANVDTQSVNISGFISEKPIIDEDFLKSLGTINFVGTMSGFFGVIMIIIGILILIVQKIRLKKSLKKTSSNLS